MHQAPEWAAPTLIGPYSPLDLGVPPGNSFAFAGLPPKAVSRVEVGPSLPEQAPLRTGNHSSAGEALGFVPNTSAGEASGFVPNTGSSCSFWGKFEVVDTIPHYSVGDDFSTFRVRQPPLASSKKLDPLAEDVTGRKNHEG